VHRIGRTGRAGASGLAVSLVGGSDARLMADIEKLIKKKIDVEAFEVDIGRRTDRPVYRRRDEGFDDRPDMAQGASSDAREHREPREHRDARPVRSAPRRAPADPFFDKPYEPSEAAEPASWEAKDAAAGAAAGTGLSRFIKPKRKVAALLGGTGTTRR